MKFFAAFLLCTTPAILLADPQITSWFTAQSDQFAHVREQTGSEPVSTWPASGLPNLNEGGATQASPVYSDIQRIAYNANNIYLESSGLASHVMGPWFNKRGNLFGRWPLDHMNLIRVTRTPTPATPATQVRTPLGWMGVLVNGAAIYNMLDAFSYQTATGTDAGMGAGDGVWNRNAEPAEGPTFDPTGAHQPGDGVYHYHISPKGLRFQLGDNLSYNSAADTYSESSSNLTHSPILGFAFDGYPVYGPYGYSDPNNPDSVVTRMISGYVPRDGANGTTDLATTGRTTLPAWAADAYGTASLVPAANHGPPVNSDFPLGWYTEDYDHLADIGNPAAQTYHLDPHNGRTCITPEYPGGTYAYFTTLDSAGDPAFPFVIGRLYYGERNGSARLSSIPANATEYFTGGASPSYLDSTPPTITLTNPTLNVALNGTFTEPGFSVTDDVDCSLEPAVTDDRATALKLDVADTYIITYSVADTAGNVGTAQRTVIVSGTGADITRPVITLTGGTVTFVAGGVFTEPGYSASDNVDGELTASVTDDHATAVNPSVPGTYTITYSVSDAAGNATNATRRVLVTATPPATSGRKNMVLIAIDDLKPKVGAYGDTGVITPNLDAFAAAGVRFANAFSQYPVCGPSRVSMLTGQRPDSLDIWTNGDASNFRTLHPNIVTLPQHFGANGYRTHGIGKLFHGNNNTSQDSAASYTDGWQNNGNPPTYYEGDAASGKWFDEDSGESSPSATDVGEFNYRNRPATPIADNDYGDGAAADRAISWLDTYEADYLSNDQPFFLAVGLNKPHLPFAAPKRYWDLYDPAAINLAAYTGIRTAPVDGANFTRPPFSEITANADFSALPNTTEARHLIHGYMACVSFVDEQVGRILDHLDNTLHPSVASNTVVVIYGDHGWHLGDHGAFWTKNSNFHESNHTIMMIRAPGLVPAVETQAVELLDVYPTLLELADLPPPAGQALQGASLTKLMDQQFDDWNGVGAYYQQQRNITGTGTDGAGMGWTIHTEQYRYTEWYTTGTPLDQALSATPSFVELYDHAVDPGELTNVAGVASYASTAAALSAQLDAGQGWREKTNPPTIRLTGDNPFHLELGATYIDPGATAFDAEDGALLPTNNAATAVTTAATGTYTVTYGVCDATALRTVTTRTVIVSGTPADTTPPVITLTGNTVTVEAGMPYVEPGFRAEDNRDGDLTSAVTNDRTSALDTSLPGPYTLTYRVADAAGNDATPTSRTVNVVDTTPPTILLTGGATTLILGQPYSEPGVSALDTVDGSVAVSDDAAAIDTRTLLSTTVMYRATDHAGNAATTSRVVNVVDGDAEGDGIPSSWEIANELDPIIGTGTDGGTNDNDGDGFTNREEYEADTKPGDATDFPVITTSESPSDGHEITFAAKATRVYTLEQLLTLDGVQRWTDVLGYIRLPGTPDGNGTMRITPPAPSGGTGFYRVRIDVP